MEHVQDYVRAVLAAENERLDRDIGIALALQGYERVDRLQIVTATALENGLRRRYIASAWSPE